MHLSPPTFPKLPRPQQAMLNEAILMGTAFIAHEATDRKKRPTNIWVRFMTPGEIDHLVQGASYPAIRADGKLIRLKITSIKRWKRDPERIEIGVKYGFYGYAKFDRAGAGISLVQVLYDPANQLGETP